MNGGMTSATILHRTDHAHSTRLGDDQVEPVEDDRRGGEQADRGYRGARGGGQAANAVGLRCYRVRG